MQEFYTNRKVCQLSFEDWLRKACQRQAYLLDSIGIEENNKELILTLKIKY
jgi:hypothetical protein